MHAPSVVLYQFKSVKSVFNFSPEVMISRIRIYLILQIYDEDSYVVGRARAEPKVAKSKAQKEPSPGQSEYNERHPGYPSAHIPCALNRRSPAEGKGNGATRRWPKGKAKWQQGTLEVPSGNTFLTFPLAPVGRGPSGYILPRVSFATLILPWARFLLGFQPVQVL